MDPARILPPLSWHCPALLPQALFAKAAAGAKLEPLIKEHSKLLKVVAAVSGARPLALTWPGQSRCLPPGFQGVCVWCVLAGSRWLACPGQAPPNPLPRAPTPSLPACTAVLLLQDQTSQLAQLVALGHLLGVTLPERAREASLALKALYDAELVPENLILAW